MSVFATTHDSAFAAVMAQIERRDRLLAEVRPANKAAVFDALAAAGISMVEVTFDGAGDSGQVESIEARIGDGASDLPDGSVVLLDPAHDGSDTNRSAMPVRLAIETLAYRCLAETHGGWENDEGAYGEFTFDVAERTISLEYNERYLETQYFTHRF